MNEHPAELFLTAAFFVSAILILISGFKFQSLGEKELSKSEQVLDLFILNMFYSIFVGLKKNWKEELKFTFSLLIGALTFGFILASWSF
jgi:hypothetical protein